VRHLGRIHKGAAQVDAGRYRTQVRRPKVGRTAPIPRGYRIAVLAMPRSIFRWTADQTNELVSWRDVYLRFATHLVAARDPCSICRVRRSTLLPMKPEYRVCATCFRLFIANPGEVQPLFWIGALTGCPPSEVMEIHRLTGWYRKCSKWDSFTTGCHRIILEWEKRS
jgi:hypothetical protein